jgi:glycosyltransferase involved in cell wall biosynthesis
MNNIFFSIIIPTYNRATWIEKTIDSILNQSYSHFEIVIVDDGSTDHTGAVVKSYSDNRVKYFYTKNQERAAARNFGLSVSTGDYVNYFDSDDLFLQDRLLDVFNWIQKNNNPDVVYTNFLNNQKIAISHTYSWNKLLQNNFFACGSVFIKKNIALKFTFNESRDLTTAEDWELWLRLMFHHHPLFLNKVTFKQVEHNDRSLNTINWYKVYQRELAFYRVSKTYFSELNALNAISLLLADRFTFMAIALYELRKNRRLILLSLNKAIRMDVRVIFRKRFWAAFFKLFR